MFTLDHVLQSLQQSKQPMLLHGSDKVIFSEAVIDSRLVTAESLFVALQGERVDGHLFVGAAFARGARAALVRRDWALSNVESLGELVPMLIDSAAPVVGELTEPRHPLLVLVDDPLRALHHVAQAERLRSHARVLGITGSVGKTSTKELTAAMLHHRFRTLKNPRSYNNEATLPLTLLQLGNNEVAVLEMGMWAPGEITLLCDLARPQFGLVTNVGPSHLERMGSIEAIAHAKGELPRSLPADGVAFLNIDDPRVRAMADETPAQVFFFGLDQAAHLWASEVESRGLHGISFRAHYQGTSASIELPLLGLHNVYTALAAFSFGLTLGMEWEAMVAGMRTGDVEMRVVLIPAQAGAQLIDDTYNASPASTLAALNLLNEVVGRRIVVLGDMLELGSYEEEGHRQVGRRVAEVADLLVACGRRVRAWVADEARASGMAPDTVIEVSDNEAAVAVLRPLLQRGDYVLVKGSRGAAMEQIVAALRRYPDAEE